MFSKCATNWLDLIIHLNEAKINNEIPLINTNQTEIGYIPARKVNTRRRTDKD